MQAKRPELYWFCFYDSRSPSVRYRALYPLRYFEKRYGYKCVLVYPGYTFARMLQFIRALWGAWRTRNHSTVVIQRVSSRFIYGSLLRLLVKFRPQKTLYDLDDADYLEKPPEQIFWFMQHCSGVMVGSRRLVQFSKSLNPNVLLNTSPVATRFHARHHLKRTLQLGWIGDYGGDHRKAIEQLVFPALKALRFACSVELIGVRNAADRLHIENDFREHPHIQLRFTDIPDWNNESHIQSHIARWDAGLAPLLPTELHLSKSAFKLKQCLQCGVPVISSDLPENNFFIKNGFNGFLCSDVSAFKQSVIRIHEMTDEALKKLSANAIASSDSFSYPVYAAALFGWISGKPASLNPVVAPQDPVVTSRVAFEETGLEMPVTAA